MILYEVSFIIFLFVSVSLFFKTECSLTIKIVGSLAVFLVSMKYVVYQVIGGAFFSPNLPRSFILTLEALYGALIILTILLAAWDIYIFGNWLLSKIGFPVPKNLPSGWIKSGFVLLALIAGGWGTWQSVKVPDVKEITLEVESLPHALNNFSIIQLSDLHIGPLLKADWLGRVVEKVNNEHPDLIALTGDFIDGQVDKIYSELKPLANLKAKYGILGVTGNHEYYWNVSEWQNALKQLGIDLLNNDHRVLNINGEKLVIGGLPDIVASKFNFEGPDLNKTFKDAPNAVRILLSHQPKEAEDFLKCADIQLSGHTHGGTMNFLQALVARYNSGFVNGYYSVDSKSLYVSPGTGLWNGFSCRIGVPSEITKIILKQKELPG